MPTLNNFDAHIIVFDPNESFPAAKQFVPEYGNEIHGNTVSCFIPVTSGAYFAAWWWPTGKHKNIPYSAEFLRDGQSVVHLFLGGEESAKYDGGVASDWEDDNGEA
jgi:hypothetical protein